MNCDSQNQFQKQKPVPLVYKEIKLACGFGPDLLVEERVVVELKSVDALGRSMKPSC